MGPKRKREDSEVASGLSSEASSSPTIPDSVSSTSGYRVRHVWTIQNAQATVFDTAKQLSQQCSTSCPESTVLMRDRPFLVGPEVLAEHRPRHNRWFLELLLISTKEGKKMSWHIGVHVNQDAPRWGPVRVHFQLGLGRYKSLPSVVVYKTDNPGQNFGIKWTLDSLLSADGLGKGGNAENDTLDVVCEMHVPPIESLREATLTTGPMMFDLAPSYQRLFDNLPRLSDMTVCTADGVVIPAHRLILQTRSPVFALLFDQPMKEHRENTVRTTALSHSRSYCLHLTARV
jgi:hypothetical protein